MFQLKQSANNPTSPETGFLYHQCRSIRFYLEKRSLELKLESVLRAAAGHEANSLPLGDLQYNLLSCEANSLCTEFANRWGLDIELLKARIGGLSKLERLSVPARSKNYAQLACFGVILVPLLCFLIGAVGGLVNVGFHLVGGR